MKETEIRWTRSFVEQFNEKAERFGLPPLYVRDGFVYLDEWHWILGIGFKMEEEP